MRLTGQVTPERHTGVPQNVYHWLDIFSAREADYLVKIANTSKGDLNTYKQCQNTVMDTINFIPRVRIFYWEAFSEDPPLWQHRRIKQQEKVTQWDYHNCKICDEWDLCKDMAVEPRPWRIKLPSNQPVPNEVLCLYLKHPLWLARHPAPSHPSPVASSSHSKTIVPSLST